jgi:hypothetical protein
MSVKGEDGVVEEGFPSLSMAGRVMDEVGSLEECSGSEPPPLGTVDGRGEEEEEKEEAEGEGRGGAGEPQTGEEGGGAA